MNETLATLPMPNRRQVDAALVSRLIAAQFPHWSDLEIRPVDTQGWDNCAFRLGDEMLLRISRTVGRSIDGSTAGPLAAQLSTT